MQQGDPTLKKRPLESPLKEKHEVSYSIEKGSNAEEGLHEPESKKVRVDDDQAVGANASPSSKKRMIKVIPPKDPSSSPIASISSTHKGPTSSPTITLKLQSSSSGTEAGGKASLSSSPKKNNLSPKPLATNGSSVKSTGAGDAEAGNKIGGATLSHTVSTKEKEEEKLNAKDRMLSHMKFNCEKSEVLRLIEVAKKEGKTVVVTDARLVNTSHQNYHLSLGHVVYTGAKSRSGFSNRASDLDLFLCPKFNPEHHFATIEVRIPSEYLSYRGNIAVRKSAVWGTDIYTDDSDIVAMIIHSGHYRPVDAPDALPGQAEEPTSSYANTSSSTKLISPILSKITPIVAQSDPSVSSATLLIPDHDLHVTLRILPRLIRYTGSTRHGLDSKGWGSLHDGESLQVVKVEKVARNSVSKQVRKAFFKGSSLENSRSFVFNSAGQTCFKYTPRMMIDWPAYLHSGIKENVVEKESKKAELFKLPFRSDDLKSMKNWPFWRVLLTKFKCILHGETTRYLVGGKNDVMVLDAKERVLHGNIPYNCVDFTDEGLVITKSERVVISFQGFSWKD